MHLKEPVESRGTRAEDDPKEAPINGTREVGGEAAAQPDNEIPEPGKPQDNLAAMQVKL